MSGINAGDDVRLSYPLSFLAGQRLSPTETYIRVFRGRLGHLYLR
jgi:hypothetical protein